MKRLFVVTVEWKLKGKGETYNDETKTFVAETAQQAVDAMISETEKELGKKLSALRLAEVRRGEPVDLIV